MELAIVVFLCLVFPAGAIYSYVRIKKQKTGGRAVLESAVARRGQRISATRTFSLTGNKQWCRVRFVIKWRDPVGKCDEQLHRYRLSLEAADGRELYAEERSITEFFGSCWHVNPKRRNEPRCVCDAVVLEFRPPWPGHYSLKLDLQAVEGPSELLTLTIMVREGVLPFKGRAYVHACVDLRKNTPRKEQGHEEGDLPIDTLC